MFLFGFIFLIIQAAIVAHACKPWIVTVKTKGLEQPKAVAWQVALWVILAQYVGDLGAAFAGGGFGSTVLVFLVLISFFAEIGFCLYIGNRSKAAIKARPSVIAMNDQEQAAQIEQAWTDYEARMRARGPMVKLGFSTATLYGRNHAGGLERDWRIYQSADDLSLGTLVVGRPGTGKTFAILGPWVRDWLTTSTTSGLFAFGVKPDWTLQIARTALFAGRSADQIAVIGEGPGRIRVNALDGMTRLSPDAAGAVAGEALSSTGSGGGDIAYFRREVASFTRNSLSVVVGLELTGPFSLTLEPSDTAAANGARPKTIVPSYDLDWVRQVWMLSREEWQAFSGVARDRAATLAEHGATDEAEDLGIALDWLDEFFSREDKNRQGITSSLSASIGALLTAPAPFRRAFTQKGKTPVDLGALLDAGGVVIVDIDLEKHRDAGALAYAFLFAQFQGYMSERLARLRTASTVLNHVGFVADEYARIARPDDLAMFQLARESRIASVVGIQTMTGLEQKIGKDAANGIANALGTTVLLPGTGDPASLALISLGQVDNETMSYSRNVGTSHSGGIGVGSLQEMMGTYGTSSGESWSSSTRQIAALDPQVYAGLRRHLGSEFAANEQWTDIVIRTFQQRQVNGQTVMTEAAEVVWTWAWAPSKDITAPANSALQEVFENRAKTPLPLRYDDATPAPTKLLKPRPLPKLECEEEEDIITG